MSELDVERRLKQLTEATRGVSARPGFADRVMQAVAHDASGLGVNAVPRAAGLLDHVVLSAKGMVSLAAALAAVAVVFATQVEPKPDDAFATDYGAVRSSDLVSSELAFYAVEVEANP